MHIRVPRSIAIGYLSTMMYIWLICTQRDADLLKKLKICLFFNYCFAFFNQVFKT